MKKYIFSTITSIIIIFIISCDYKPTDINYNELDTISNRVNIPLAFDFTYPLNVDTIDIFNSRYSNIKFQYKDLKYKLHSYGLIFDNELKRDIKSYNSSDNSFEYEYIFNTNTFIEYHTVTLIINVDALTNSLAEIKLGKATVQFKKKWILRVINYNAIQFDSIKFVNENSKLKLKWRFQQSDYVNNLKYLNEIEEFTLFKSINNGMILENQKIKYKINQYEYECEDTSYIGENAQYYLNFRTKDYRTYEYKIRGNKEAEIKNIKCIIENLKPKLIWDKCNYPNNFSYYYLYNNSNAGENKIFKNINDTIYTLNEFSFGNFINYTVNINAKKYSSLEDNYSLKYSQILGNAFQNFEKIQINNEFVYFKKPKDDYLYKYNIITQKIEENTDLQSNYFALSPNGKYLIWTNKYNKILYSNEDKLYLNVLILDLLKNLGVNPDVSFISINDQGFCAILNNNKVYFFDFIKKGLVNSKQFNTSAEIIISPDSKYFVAKYSKYLFEIYSINSNEILKIQSIEGTFNYFVPKYTDRINYTNSNSEIFTLDCSNSQNSTSIQNYGNFKNIDYINNKAVYVNSQKNIVIVEASTNQILKTYDFKFNDNFTFANNTLYFNNGSSLKLD